MTQQTVKPKIKWRAFGKDLRGVIEQWGGSMRGFARAKKLSHATVSRAWRGLPVDAPHFMRLCRECGLDPWSYAA